MAKQTDIVYSTPEYPRQLRLDTTTSCNARCLSCHRFLTDRKGAMSGDLLNRVLNDVSRWTVPLSEIIPVNYGEFFLRNDWFSLLLAISRKLPQTQITIPTNGAKLNDEGIDNLCKIPTLKLINFSINAFFEETYEVFTGLPYAVIPSIEIAIKRIKAQRQDIKIWASMVFDPAYHSDYERDMFLEYWKPKVDLVWVISASSANRPGKVCMIPRIIPCRSIFSDIVIGFDGKLSSCCWDSGFTLDLGYYSGDLKKDWHNPKLVEFRRIHDSHKRFEIPLCKDCTSA